VLTRSSQESANEKVVIHDFTSEQMGLFFDFIYRGCE